MRMRIRGWRMIVLAILLMEGALAPLASGNSAHASATPPAAGPSKHTRAPGASIVASRDMAIAQVAGAPTTIPPAFARSPQGIDTPNSATMSTLQRAYGKLPLSFELNQGQTDGQVKALARGAGYTLFLTNAGATLTLVKRQAPTARKGLSPHVAQSHARVHGQPLPLGRLGDLIAQREGDKVTESAVRLTFAGANRRPQIVGLDKLPGVSNYFIGNDRHKWRTNVAHYAKIEYKNVYPGVNLIYYGNQGKLEYDWVVEPGANPNAVRLAIQQWGRGANGSKSSGARLDRRGNLLIHTASGDLVQSTPVVYQNVAGRRRAVKARYTFTGTDRVGFAVGAYDTSKPLVIDPVLAYSTYLGGTGADAGQSIAVDSTGGVYITGFTSSTDFPTMTPIQGTNAGNSQATDASNRDVFVTKLNAAGNALVYSTYLGGNAGDDGIGIAVDGVGNAYITGETQSTNFPTVNAVQGVYRGFSGSYEAFMAKLNTTGNNLSYSSYLGGNSDSAGLSIAVDGAGNAYVTGTASASFPLVNAFQETYNSGTCGTAFVAKFDATGTTLLYSTYLGGSDCNEGYGIAVDSAGNAYVTGYTYAYDFPTTANAFQTTRKTVSVAFVTKLNATGSALVYSTYLGGSNNYNMGYGIAVDSAGDAYVTGYTNATDFPTVNPFQATLAGGEGAFVTKLNATGSSLVYSTYLGGSQGGASNDDLGKSIAVDSAGDAYVTGDTRSSNFPIVSAFQTANTGNGNAFVTKLNATGNGLVYSTYFGGSNADDGRGIAVDKSGNA